MPANLEPQTLSQQGMHIGNYKKQRTSAIDFENMPKYLKRALILFCRQYYDSVSLTVSRNRLIDLRVRRVRRLVMWNKGRGRGGEAKQSKSWHKCLLQGLFCTGSVYKKVFRRFGISARFTICEGLIRRLSFAYYTPYFHTVPIVPSASYYHCSFREFLTNAWLGNTPSSLWSRTEKEAAPLHLIAFQNQFNLRSSGRTAKSTNRAICRC